jgi:hypothetical protein
MAHVHAAQTNHIVLPNFHHSFVGKAGVNSQQ